MSAWPLHRAAPNRSLLHATATPTPSGGLGSTNSRRIDANSTRSWPFYTKSLAWTPSPAIDARCRMFLCRESPPPPRGTTTGTSAARLPISPAAAHLHRRRVGCRATTTNATTRAQTSTLMATLALTLTLRHSSGGRLRTLLLRPCCYAAAQSSRPPRSDECANS
jgi:hypothetical protein